jgi:hypothetical protein
MRIPLIIGLLICVFSCSTKKDNLREQHFDSLDLAERDIIQFDSVDGEYLKWKGTNHDSVTWALYFDKPNRFAIKSFFADKTGFFTKVPGNINASGQWTEKDDRLILKFYFPSEDWSIYFDSLDNEAIKVINRETIEIDKQAESIWIVSTECKKVTD